MARLTRNSTKQDASTADNGAFMSEFAIDADKHRANPRVLRSHRKLEATLPASASSAPTTTRSGTKDAKALISSGVRSTRSTTGGGRVGDCSVPKAGKIGHAVTTADKSSDSDESIIVNRRGRRVIAAYDDEKEESSMEEATKVVGLNTKPQKKGKKSKQPNHKSKLLNKKSDEERNSVSKPRTRDSKAKEVSAVTKKHGEAHKPDQPRRADSPTEREERWITDRSWRDVYEPDVTVYFMDGNVQVQTLWLSQPLQIEGYHRAETAHIEFIMNRSLVDIGDIRLRILPDRPVPTTLRKAQEYMVSWLGFWLAYFQRMGDLDRARDAGKVLFEYMAQEGLYSPGMDTGSLPPPVREQFDHLYTQLGLQPTHSIQSIHTASSEDSWAGFPSEEEDNQANSDEESWSGISSDEEDEDGQENNDESEQVRKDEHSGDSSEDLGKDHIDETSAQIRKTSPSPSHLSGASSGEALQDCSIPIGSDHDIPTARIVATTKGGDQCSLVNASATEVVCTTENQEYDPSKSAEEVHVGEAVISSPEIERVASRQDLDAVVAPEVQKKVDCPPSRPRVMTMAEYFRQKRAIKTAELRSYAQHESDVENARNQALGDLPASPTASENDQGDTSSQDMSLDSDSDSGLILSASNVSVFESRVSHEESRKRTQLGRSISPNVPVQGLSKRRRLEFDSINVNSPTTTTTVKSVSPTLAQTDVKIPALVEENNSLSTPVLLAPCPLGAPHAGLFQATLQSISDSRQIPSKTGPVVSEVESSRHGGTPARTQSPPADPRYRRRPASDMSADKSKGREGMSPKKRSKAAASKAHAKPWVLRK